MYVAGLAYLGDYQYADSNYALARGLNAEDQALDRHVRAALEALRPTHLELRFELGDLDRTDTIVMAIALDRERVSRERFAFRQGFRTKVIVEASLQILFYDLATGALVDNVPVSAAINHVLRDEDAIDAETKRLAEMLYLGDGEDQGLLVQATAKLAAFSPRVADGLRYQLASFTLHERTLGVLPSGQSADQVLQSFGQSFSARLAEQTPVSVIPFARGYAFGNQLPGRFSNGEVFNLQLPEPDYAFHVELKRLSKHEQDDQLIFLTQAFLRFVEPVTGRALVAGDYRTQVPKLASAARIESDDWSAYQDAVEALFDSWIEQLKEPTRRWHTQHAREKESFSQFRKAGELFQ